MVDLDLAPVTVGVVDTGIDGDHDDLADNIDSNYSYDFGGDTSINAVVDSSGHGTKVAGIIKGVCENVKLVSLKVDNDLDDDPDDILSSAVGRKTVERIDDGKGGKSEDFPPLLYIILSVLFVDKKHLRIEHHYHE